MSLLLQIAGSQVPVTALNTDRNLIFVGQGFFLTVFDRSSHRILLSRQIFDSQAIHGFTVWKDGGLPYVLLLIWGGRQICGCALSSRRHDVLDALHDSRLSLEQSNNVDCGAWIYDVVFTPSALSENANTAMLITAHNHLHKIRLSKDTSDSGPNLTLNVSSLSEGPRCGLYSATLQWLSGRQVLVAAGTAFGEIVIWSMTPNETGSETSIHYVLTGHEGSIFGVRISSLILLENGRQLRLLASCSDDRAIRIWDITDLSRDLGPEFGMKRRGKLATGFLEYNWEQVDALSRNLCVASAMGHQSRIWDVHFRIRSTREQGKSLATIISVGEDATAHSWNLGYGHGSDSILSLIGVARHHEGKNIWSSFVSEDSSGGNCTLTGGADGKVIEHNQFAGDGSESAPLLQITNLSIDSINLQFDKGVSPGRPDWTDSGERSSTATRKGGFRSFEILHDGRLLVTTNEGEILLAKGRDSNPAWEKLGYFEGLRGYSVACRIARGTTDYVFLGDGHGGTYYFCSDPKSVSYLTQVEGKISNLLAGDLSSKSLEAIGLVLLRQGALPPVQLRLEVGNTGTLSVARSYIACTDPNDLPNVTSCVVMTQQEEELGLIFGCRNGSICSYQHPDSTAVSTGVSSKIVHAHGKEAVTAMRWVSQHEHEQGRGWLFSVGRDGTLAVHRFDGHGRRPELVHQLALPFGPNVEGLSVEPESQKIMVWGFSSRYFICHDISANEDLVRIECGGAHRLWSFRLSDGLKKTSATTAFAWVKAMKLSVATVDGIDHKVIQPGLHGREIKACAVASRTLDEYLGPLVATGAEDTTIMISHVTNREKLSQDLQQIAVLRKHTTGIQALRWSGDGQYLFSCGGFSEAFVWKIQKVPGIRIGVICLAQIPLDKNDLELRITDIDIRQPEDTAPEFDIAISLSDSSIQIWSLRMSIDVPIWELRASSKYTSNCITTIINLNHSLLVSGSTDGRLVCWSRRPTDPELIPTKVQSLHQSSIKGLDLVRLDTNHSVILTSGDDNAIGCNLLTSGHRGESVAISSVMIPKAHAAAIGAIKALFVNKMQGTDGRFKIRFITASNDQQIKLWDLAVSCGEDTVDCMNVAKVGCWVSAVADISSLGIMDVEREGQDGRSDATLVLICGVGVEIWRAHS